MAHLRDNAPCWMTPGNVVWKAAVLLQVTASQELQRMSLYSLWRNMIKTNIHFSVLQIKRLYYIKGGFICILTITTFINVRKEMAFDFRMWIYVCYAHIGSTIIFSNIAGNSKNAASRMFVELTWYTKAAKQTSVGDNQNRTIWTQATKTL